MSATHTCRTWRINRTSRNNGIRR